MDPAFSTVREAKRLAHSTGECRQFPQMRTSNHGRNDCNTQGAFHNFMGIYSRTERKVLMRAINAIQFNVSQRLNWFEQVIQWSKEDHAPKV
jgi:hypothetical protein